MENKPDSVALLPNSNSGVRFMGGSCSAFEFYFIPKTVLCSLRRLCRQTHIYGAFEKCQSAIGCSRANKLSVTAFCRRPQLEQF